MAARTKSTTRSRRAPAAKKRATAKKKAPARGRKPARSTTTKSTAQRRADRPGIATTLNHALEGRGADLTGLFLIVLGVLAALGIWTSTSGLLGRAFDEGFGWMIGVFRYFAPIVIIAAGVSVIRRAGNAHVLSPRLVVGGFAALVATAGLVHLVGGRPPWGSTTQAFSDAGGVIGLAIGGPLVAIASTWGATLILVSIGVGGLLVMTGLSLGSLVDGLGRGARPIAGAAAGGARSLFVMGDRAVADHDLVEEHDGDLPMDDSPTILVGGRDVDRTVEIPVPAPVDEPADVAEAATETEVVDSAPFDQDEPARPEPTVVVPTPIAPQQLEAAELAITNNADRAWTLPSMGLLNRSSSQNVDESAVLQRGRVLERALAEHGVETRLINMVVGPTVTRFELELGTGVKVSKVKNLNDDIAYAMASPDVRIIAPIPGKQAIGVEVPNETRQIVAVGDILGSVEAQEATGAMEVAVGRDINGASLLVDLSKMPHTLVAGATGAGKSSGINSIITSLLMRNTPDDVRMILIDPKRVEMTQYERIPHLLTQPVTDPKKAANALAWAVREMERRYELLEECRFRDIGGYNAAVDDGKLTAKKGELGPDGEPRTFSRLPYILVVVDELADLMMVAARDVEDSIVRIGQKARAVGIHMVIATQRPSVDVITGLIKANVPARVAYAVSSMQDSRVILGAPGAERLVGRGDMLFLDPTSSTPMRLQGAWVEESEVKKVVGHWRKQMPEVETSSGAVLAEPAPNGASPEAGVSPVGALAMGDAPAANPTPEAAPISTADQITADRPTVLDDDADEFLEQAMELVINSGLGSTSMLQRKLRVGFARAGRIMDELEQKGVVGPSEGSKAREVLWSAEDLQRMRGQA